MARDFNGTTSNLTMPSNYTHLNIGVNLLTISVWIVPDTFATGWRGIVAKFGPALAQFQMAMINNSSAIRWEVGDGPGSDKVDFGSVQVGRLYHLVGVKEGTGASAIRAYFNGAFAGSNTSNRNLTANSPTFKIGSNDVAGENFDGRIAEVAIWQDALTLTEIENLYARTISPLDRLTNLRGYWPICGLASPEPDLAQGFPITVNSAPQSPHPFTNIPWCVPQPDQVAHIGHGRGRR